MKACPSSDSSPRALRTPEQPAILLTASELAEAAGLRPNAIRVMERAGAIPAAGAGARRFDREACLRAIAANRPSADVRNGAATHGGARRNAGRNGAAGVQSDGGEDQPRSLPAGDTLAAYQRRLTLAKAEAAERENRLADGRALPTDDVKRAWADLLGTFGRELDAVPRKAASAVLATLGIGPERSREVERAIDGILRDARERLADDPIGRG